MHISRPRTLDSRGFDHVLLALAFAVIVALGGTYWLVQSHAATPIARWKGTLETFSNNSGYCLTSNAGTTSSKVVLKPCTASNKNQQWSIVNTKTVTVLGAASVQEFYIQNGAGTNECLNNPYGTKKSGAALQLYPCKSTDSASIWAWGAKLTGKGFSSHQLINIASISGSNGLCVDDAYGSKTSGTKVQAYTCKKTTQSNQNWFEDTAPSGTTGGSGGGCTSGSDVAPCVGSATTGASGWGAPVFDDEFTGTSLSGKWAPSWFNGGKVNNDNGVTMSPKNVSVTDGNAVLTLASSSSGATIDTDPSQVSPGFQFGTGYYVEARLYVPGSGSTLYNWPAFWTDGQSWPTNGESDILEGLGTATSNYHSPSGASNSGTIAGTWSNGWHTYALDRESGKDSIYWDGKLVRSYAPNDKGAPQYLILSLDCSGGCKTGASYQLKADYVRAWKKQ